MGVICHWRFAMRRILIFLLCALLAVPALAEQAARVEDCVLIPGQGVNIRYFVPETGEGALFLADQAGGKLMDILSPRNLLGGNHILSLEAGFFEDLGEGSYRVVLAWAGGEAAGTLTVGQAAPEEPEEPQEPQKPAVEVLSWEEQPVITPALRSQYTVDHKNCYWCTPMDITDEDAIWGMLTSPMTVVNLKQKEQALLYAEPDAKSETIAVVTGASQAVHVLEEKDGWTLVETYSSSFHDSKVKNWNAFVTGYIQSSKLKTVTVNQEYGLIVDKLTQRVYVFHDGHLMTELLCSTGLYNDRQPYNETRSGEFMVISRVGDFKSDNLVCGLGLRFNSGDLLHEVPHTVNADGTKNYKNCEPKLGTRASHGCIRVQRLKNADGINMRWIWDNIKVGTRLVVWEDYQGRQIPVPAADTPLYYNPNGGSNYHSTATCTGVKSQYLPLAAFTYGELDTGSYAELTPCRYCCPPARQAEIEEINRVHLETSPGEVMSYWPGK